MSICYKFLAEITAEHFSSVVSDVRTLPPTLVQFLKRFAFIEKWSNNWFTCLYLFFSVSFPSYFYGKQNIFE